MFALHLFALLCQTQPPTLLVGPTDLDFSTPPQSSPGRYIAVRSPDNTSRPFTFRLDPPSASSWLSVRLGFQATNQTPSSLSVSPSFFTPPAPGTYRATVVVESPGLEPARVNVVFTVRPDAPAPVPERSVTFYHQQGSDLMPELDVPSNLSSSISRVHPVTGGPWLRTVASLGSSTLHLIADPSTLPNGIYRNIIRTPSSNGPILSADLIIGSKPVFQIPSVPLDFTVHPGLSASKSLSVRWSDGAARELTLTPSAPWLRAEYRDGVVSIDADGIAEGVHTAELAVSSEDAANPPVRIPVMLNVTSQPILTASVPEVEVELPPNRAVPQSQPAAIEISADGEPATNFEVSVTSPATWLSAARIPGTNKIALIADALSAELGPFTTTQRAEITVKSPGGNTLRIPARLNASSELRQLSVDIPAVSFQHQLGAAPSPAKTVEISFSGPDVPFTAESPAKWLRISRAGGGNKLSLSINDPDSLQPGLYRANVRISSTLPAAGRADILVLLTVSEDPLARANRSLVKMTTKRDQPAALQQITFQSTDGSAQPVQLMPTPEWLLVEPRSGVTPFTVSVTTARLAEGNYSTDITTDHGEIIRIQVLVEPNTPANSIATNPTAILMSHAHGESFGGKFFQVTAGEQTRVGYSAATTTGGNWLDTGVDWNAVAFPAIFWTGSTARAAAFVSGSNSLPPGSYNGTIALTAAGVDTLRVPVTLNVEGLPGPQITAEPSSISLTARSSSPALVKQVIRVTGAQAALSSRIVSSDSSNSWISATNTSANSIELTINPAALQPGAYWAELVIGSRNNVYRAVPIRVEVTR